MKFREKKNYLRLSPMTRRFKVFQNIPGYFQGSRSQNEFPAFPGFQGVLGTLLLAPILIKANQSDPQDQWP